MGFFFFLQIYLPNVVNPVFKELQLESFQHFLAGLSVVLVKSTGGGKTLPVILTALVLNTLPIQQFKTILVIAPTKVLIQSHIAIARGCGLSAETILEETTPAERTRIVSLLEAGNLNICAFTFWRNMWVIYLIILFISLLHAGRSNDGQIRAHSHWAKCRQISRNFTRRGPIFTQIEIIFFDGYIYSYFVSIASLYLWAW